MSEGNAKVDRRDLTLKSCSGICDFTRQCDELKNFLNETVPDANVACIKSKTRGAFEVKINDVLVHSKAQTVAFPVYEDVAENVRNCQQGKAMTIVAQQKITDCCIS